MTGVAEKVTEVPAHTGFADAATEMLTGRIGLTVMVTVSDVAGLPLLQVSLEVRLQVISSPFIGINSYVALVAPGTLVPFTFH